MTTLHNVLAPSNRGRTQTNPHTQFNTRARPDHWGVDLRPAKFDTPGDPVYAPADARVALVGYGRGGRSAPIPWHSGRFVLLDLGVWGGDQMFCYFGHLATTRVHEGQRISAGHIIGTMGGSGATGERDFGVYLHIGVCQNTTRPTGVIRNGKGWIDPAKWFALHGVNLDTSQPATTSRPKPTTATTHKEAELSAAEVRQINDHTKEQADRIVRALADVRRDLSEAVRTTSQTSAWVIDPATGEQREVYLSGVLQRVDSKLTAVTEAMVQTGTIDPGRLATLNPAIKTVKKD